MPYRSEGIMVRSSSHSRLSRAEPECSGGVRLRMPLRSFADKSAACFHRLLAQMSAGICQNALDFRLGAAIS